MQETFVQISSSFAAAYIGILCINPGDTIKVRYQVMPKETSGMLKFGQKIIAEEGFYRGLYRPGLFANSLGIATGAIGRVGMYPSVRDAMLKMAGCQEGQKPASIMLGAGFMSGAFGYLLAQPVYQVKTLSQVEAGMVSSEGILTTGALVGQKPKYQKIIPGLTLLQAEGHLMRGAGTLVIRGALLSAGQQLGYDGMKTQAKKMGFEDTPALHMASSIAGAFGSACLCTPPDVVMTRFQAASAMGITYNGQLACALSILKEAGPQGFYRGWLPNFLRLSPLYCLSLPLTEQFRRLGGYGYMK